MFTTPIEQQVKEHLASTLALRRGEVAVAAATCASNLAILSGLIGDHPGLDLLQERLKSIILEHGVVREITEQTSESVAESSAYVEKFLEALKKANAELALFISTMQRLPEEAKKGVMGQEQEERRVALKRLQMKCLELEGGLSKLTPNSPAEGKKHEQIQSCRQKITEKKGAIDRAECKMQSSRLLYENDKALQKSVDDLLRSILSSLNVQLPLPLGAFSGQLEQTRNNVSDAIRTKVRELVRQQVENIGLWIKDIDPFVPMIPPAQSVRRLEEGFLWEPRQYKGKVLEIATGQTFVPRWMLEALPSLPHRTEVQTLLTEEIIRWIDDAGKYQKRTGVSPVFMRFLELISYETLALMRGESLPKEPTDMGASIFGECVPADQLLEGKISFPSPDGAKVTNVRLKIAYHPTREGVSLAERSASQWRDRCMDLIQQPIFQQALRDPSFCQRLIGNESAIRLLDKKLSEKSLNTDQKIVTLFRAIAEYAAMEPSADTPFHARFNWAISVRSLSSRILELCGKDVGRHRFAASDPLRLISGKPERVYATVDDVAECLIPVESAAIAASLDPHIEECREGIERVYRTYDLTDEEAFLLADKAVYAIRTRTFAEAKNSPVVLSRDKIAGTLITMSRSDSLFNRLDMGFLSLAHAERLEKEEAAERRMNGEPS